MKCNYSKVFILLLGILYSVPSFTQSGLTNSSHLIEEFNNGQIDWTAQVIEARGKSYINREKFKIEAQAIDMAQLGAEAIAKANLLQIIQDVKVTRITSVSDLMNQSDSVRTVTEGVIRGARTVGPPTITPDAVEVTVRMRLYDQGGLAPAIEPFLPLSKYEKVQVNELPGRTSQRQSPVQITGTTAGRPGTTQVLLPLGDTSALLLNFDQNKYNPSIFPVLVDEEGNVLLDLSEKLEKSKKEYQKYIEMAERVSKDTNFRKGIEMVEAIQNVDGTIRIANVKKKAKLKKILNILKEVGAFAIPLLL